MKTWHAINTIRVVRQFADRPLAPEHIDRILNAGWRAGSSWFSRRRIPARDREREVKSSQPASDAPVSRIDLSV